MPSRYRPRMKRKPPISEEQAHSGTEHDSVHHPIRAQELEKQYRELCKLREQVQIAESRRRVLSNG
jgi:hypothetical protein